MLGDYEPYHIFKEDLPWLKTNKQTSSNSVRSVLTSWVLLGILSCVCVIQARLPHMNFNSMFPVSCSSFGAPAALFRRWPRGAVNFTQISTETFVSLSSRRGGRRASQIDAITGYEFPVLRSPTVYAFATAAPLRTCARGHWLCVARATCVPSATPLSRCVICDLCVSRSPAATAIMTNVF